MCFRLAASLGNKSCIFSIQTTFPELSTAFSGKAKRDEANRNHQRAQNGPKGFEAGWKIPKLRKISRAFKTIFRKTLKSAGQSKYFTKKLEAPQKNFEVDRKHPRSSLLQGRKTRPLLTRSTFLGKNKYCVFRPTTTFDNNHAFFWHGSQFGPKILCLSLRTVSPELSTAFSGKARRDEASRNHQRAPNGLKGFEIGRNISKLGEIYNKTKSIFEIPQNLEVRPTCPNVSQKHPRLQKTNFGVNEQHPRSETASRRRRKKKEGAEEEGEKEEKETNDEDDNGKEGE